MASSVQLLLILYLMLLISMASSVSHNPILPKAAIFPVTKDPSTLQYVAQVFLSENLHPVNLVVDLNYHFLWVNHGSKPVSESHQPIKSCSLKCSMAKPTKPCYSVEPEYNSKTCTLQAENTVSRMSTSADLEEDAMAVEFWDGAIGSFSVVKSEKFLFLSAPNLLLKGLANGAKGILGLANSRISLPSQISTTFGFFNRRFSLCLSPSKQGAIFFGGSPSDNQISTPMMFTPLIFKKDEGYYINVNSIKISGKKLSLNHQKGCLEAKLSTVLPYTTLESKIYSTFVKAYVKAAVSMNLTLVPPVSPFEACFSTKGGQNVPMIDLVLQSEVVKWRMNSMAYVGDDVMCLGFLDGGMGFKDKIVVGGYQMEDYLLEFDLGSSMLGFSSLVMGEKKCSDFEASSLSREVF